jgi:hypothetical protein
MEVSTTSFSPTQMILAWTLLVLLLCWFIIFATLALRNVFMKKNAWEDEFTSSRPIPIIGIQSIEEHPNLVGTTRNALHHAHPNTERSHDSGTSLIR